MLQTIDLIKEYTTGDIISIALSHINFDIDKGEYISIFGPSGSGKSSLVNILGLLDTQTSGDIIINGIKINDLNDKERLAIRKKEIGFVFDSPKLIDELTITENIELPLLYQKVSKKHRSERITDLLEQMNLVHLKKHYPKNLSNIQQQKVSIARALANKPSLILADEPTGNLNSADGDEILSLLNKINDNGTTLIVFTHSEKVAERGHKTMHLYDGHLVTDNTLK